MIWREGRGFVIWWMGWQMWQMQLPVAVHRLPSQLVCVVSGGSELKRHAGTVAPAVVVEVGVPGYKEYYGKLPKKPVPMGNGYGVTGHGCGVTV
jgi:hypothetical protein